MAFGADAKEAFWAQRVGNSDGIRGMGAGSTRKNDGAEAFAPPDAIDRPSSNDIIRGQDHVRTVSSQGRKVSAATTFTLAVMSGHWDFIGNLR